MRRSLKIAAVTLGMAALSAGAAFAAGWQKNDKDWWYGANAAASNDSYTGRYTYQYNINDFGK